MQSIAFHCAYLKERVYVFADGTAHQGIFWLAEPKPTYNEFWLGIEFWQMPLPSLHHITYI